MEVGWGIVPMTPITNLGHQNSVGPFHLILKSHRYSKMNSSVPYEYRIDVQC